MCVSQVYSDEFHSPSKKSDVWIRSLGVVNGLVRDEIADHAVRGLCKYVLHASYGKPRSRDHLN